MAKPSFPLVASLLLNMFLIGWLVEQYLNDVYFQIFVNQYSTFFILTIGVGAGSTVGYLFLRRRGRSGLEGIQRTKPFRLDGASHGSPTFTAQSRALPAGAPPSAPSKHTAYAVPPISKSSTGPTQSFQKSVPSTSWVSAAKQVATKQPSVQQPPPLGPKQLSTSPDASVTGRPTTFSAEQQRSSSGPSINAPSAGSARPDFQAPPSSSMTPAPRGEQFSPVRQAEQKPTQMPEFSKWQPEVGQGVERREQSFPTARPGTEGFGRADQALNRVPVQGFGESASRPAGSQPGSESLGSKWQAPDSGAGTRQVPSPPPGQWVSPVPRQPFTPAARPGAPSAFPGQRPPPGAPPRQGEGAPNRPLFPPGQGPPRPLAMPGMVRPAQPGQGPPGGFRPGTVVTGPQGIPQRSMGPGQAIGPRPSQFSPQSSDQRSAVPPAPDRAGLSGLPGSKTLSDRELGLETQSSGTSLSSSEASESAASAGTEMDWDTALDTILKTLRKDKVGEKSG